MTHGKKFIVFGIAAAYLTIFGSASAQQARYPSRVVTVTVPFTAGTEADTLARLFARNLSERMGQTFVVENRPGAGGALAAQSVLNAPADGYTLMFVSSGLAINPAIYAHLPFDTSRDFSGIALVGQSPVVLVTSPSLGVHDQKEFISHAKKEPGKLNYGSAGVGSATYFGCAYFATEAKLNLVHVPYKGVQEPLTEIMAGRLQLACPPAALALPQVHAGKLMALSVASKERLPQLAKIPTTSEAGLPGFDYGIWYGMVASSKTPKAIINQLAKEMTAIGRLKDVSNAMETEGVTPSDIVGSNFDKFIAAEINKYRDLVRAAGIKSH